MTIQRETPTIFDESAYLGPEFQAFRQRTWPRPADEVARIAAVKASLDPITVDVVEGGLESAIEEGEAVVERTSRAAGGRGRRGGRAARAGGGGDGGARGA